MIWGLLLRPIYWRRLAINLRDAYLWPRCAVTGEHVPPRARTAHEHNEHYGEGPCK